MAADLYAVRIYEPNTENRCVVCAGYPYGWAADVVLRGIICLCEGHRDHLRGVIEERRRGDLLADRAPAPAIHDTTTGDE